MLKTRGRGSFFTRNQGATQTIEGKTQAVRRFLIVELKELGKIAVHAVNLRSKRIMKKRAPFVSQISPFV